MEVDTQTTNSNDVPIVAAASEPSSGTKRNDDAPPAQGEAPVTNGNSSNAKADHKDSREDSDDDRPLSAIATPRKPAPTRANDSDDDKPLSALKPAVKAEDSDDDRPLSALKSTKKAAAFSDSDDDKPLSALKPAPGTPKKNTTTTTTTTTTTKSSVKKEPKSSTKARAKRKHSDSEDDDFVSSPAKKTPAKKTPAKRAPKKAKKEADDDDFESEEESKSDNNNKRKATPKVAAKKRAKKEESSGSEDEKTSSAKKRKGKAKVKGEDDEDAESEEEVWEWWNEEPLADGKQWRTLHHNGVVFPPAYKSHGIKFVYNGEDIDLPLEAEEYATYFAQYLETDHYKKDAFKKNFWEQWRALLKPLDKAMYKKITDFKKADFSKIHKYIMDRKEKNKNRSKEEKLKEKEEKEAIRAKYGYAILDGHKQRVSNFMVEPPGLFLGRGAHPKTGSLKRRTMPEDVTINVSEDAKVPEVPLAGHEWKEVVHDDEVMWLAFYKEKINGAFKYIWLHASSRTKGISDREKFEVARKLKKKIGKIRANYLKDLDSSNRSDQQCATAIYLIDHLALRVGNEKGEDEAETFGCCSLLVQHVTLEDDNVLTLDFLGKDSMRYNSSATLKEPKVYRNIKSFLKDEDGKKKKGTEELFESLNVGKLNNFLASQMKGLSAKVFRTYNASITLEEELAKAPESLKEASADAKLAFYNKANKAVAILCNHQKSMSKGFSDQMAKMDTQLKEFEDRKKFMQSHLAYLKKKGPKPDYEAYYQLEEELAAARKRKPKVEPKIEPKDEVKAEKAEEPPKSRKKASKDDSDSDCVEDDTPKAKRTLLPNDVDKVKAQIEKLDARINSAIIKKSDKDETKTVALGTSKINYMDPRITASWCKFIGLDIGRVFAKTLREKFPWAMAEEDFKF